jgi:hypothetical protein
VCRQLARCACARSSGNPLSIAFAKFEKAPAGSCNFRSHHWLQLPTRADLPAAPSDAAGRFGVDIGRPTPDTRPWPPEAAPPSRRRLGVAPNAAHGTPANSAGVAPEATASCSQGLAWPERFTASRWRGPDVSGLRTTGTYSRCCRAQRLHTPPGEQGGNGQRIVLAWHASFRRTSLGPWRCLGSGGTSAAGRPPGQLVTFINSLPPI